MVEKSYKALTELVARPKHRIFQLKQKKLTECEAENFSLQKRTTATYRMCHTMKGYATQ